MTLTELEQITHLDWEFSPPCETSLEQCGKAAEWLLTGVLYCGCKTQRVLCQAHKDIYDNRLGQEGNWFCMFCRESQKGVLRDMWKTIEWRKL